MIKTLVRLGAAKLFLVCLVLLIGASERAVHAQCESTTDAQIVAEIYGKIKADKGLEPQISHINVVAVYGAVKFQGWADSKRDHDKVVDIGMTSKCVKLVNVNLFSEAPPATDSPQRASKGCAAGMKPCGDVCIPEGDSCNIESFKSAGLAILDPIAADKIGLGIFGCGVY